MKTRFLALALIVLATICAHAGSISCTTATALVPDGSSLDFDSVQANTDDWYRFTAVAGRSYSIAVRDDLDLDNPDFTVTFYGNAAFPPSSCSSPSPLPQLSAGSGYTDTTATEPALPANAKRVSIVTPSSFTGGANTYWIKVHNGSTTTSHYVSIGVTETTLYAPNWSTYSGFNTGWSFRNTTSQTIAYTFTAVADAGAGTYTTSGNIPSISSVSPYAAPSTGALSIPASQGGYALFTHNGPPGALAPFAYETNGTTYTVVPVLALRGK